MSWVSRAKNAFLNILAGKPSDTRLIENPTTPLESILNTAASIVLPAAAAMPGANAAAMPIEAISAALNEAPKPTPAGAVNDVVTAIGSVAKLVTGTYLTTHIGASNVELADAAAEALASAAIGAMSASGNKTEEDIANALHDFLNGFHGTTPVMP